MKYDMAKKTLQRTAQYWPQAHLDGYYNMWICKPGARSRGKGIVIMNSVEKILDLLNHGNSREANWVVQKYMERPLLVYKTKFDIRQWFIISDWTPLTVWFYK
jgi:tubulin monoglycylase TTLL3/8